MARAGKALKQVLERYNISQNQLATTMGVDRSNVSRWVSGSRDPSAEAVVAIRRALLSLRPPAAEEFVQVYLYEESAPDLHELHHAGKAIHSPAPVVRYPVM